MTHQHSTSRSAAREAGDDFTRIRGIGPINERRLHRAGICTFADLAASSAEAIASLLPKMSAKQITKQAWIPQARKLIPNNAQAPAYHREPVISTSRQHYDNFTVEFLLDDKNKTRRIRVVHIQSGDVDTCAKWDAVRLFDFLARHTGAHLSYAKSNVLTQAKLIPKPSTAMKQPAERGPAATSEPLVGKPNENVDLTSTLKILDSRPQIPESSDQLPLETHPHPRALPPDPANPITKIRLLEWKTLHADTNQPLQNIPCDQAFDVSLSLDLTDAALSDICQLDFTACLYAKKLGNGHPQAVGETQRTMPYADRVDLTIGHFSLPEGQYRLEVLLKLVPMDSSLVPRSGIHSSLQGGLFQVY